MTAARMSQAASSVPGYSHRRSSLRLNWRVVRGSWVGAATAGIINADGLFRLAGFQGPVGAFNPVLGPIVATWGIVLFVMWSRGKPLTKSEHLMSNMLVLMLCSAVLILGLLGSESELAKVARDLTYIGIFYVFFLNGKSWVRSPSFSIRTFARTVAVLSLLVGPTVALAAWGFESSARFGGLVVSYSLFAVVSLLIAVLTLAVDTSGLWRLLVAAMALIAILASGTRSVLVLYMIVVPLVVWRTVGRKGLETLCLGLTGAFLVGSVGALLIRWMASSSGVSAADLRVFSVDDASGGSIASRLAWVSLIWQPLADSGFIGGFGAGAAEGVIRVLPHFDFLRFWFDYSFAGMGLLAALLVSVIVPSRRCLKDPLRLLVLGMVVALTTHNVFQAPGPLLLIALVLAATWYLPGAPQVKPATRRAS